MALTAAVKEELARVAVQRSSERKAEVSAMLRFAGGLHIISGRIVIEAELDQAATARRLRTAIGEVYGHGSEIIVVSGGNLRRGNRYVIRVVRDGESLARQTGLLDVRGRPVRGLPSTIVNGSVGDAEAVWRGAFLAHGSVTEPGRSSALEVTCPGPEAALALCGAARRLGIIAKAREVRGVDRVVIAGVSTHACIAQTTRDAYANNIRAAIVPDAIGDERPDHRETVLDQLVEDRQAELVPLEEVIGTWKE